ncbi:MAG: cysteine desulfurase [Anaerolineales bacterium]|nr:cysteine desulfurase [Anaerolineales bacterium]
MSLVELDSGKIRAEFPALSREIRPGVPLVYLDTTATSQKPLRVLEAMERYYRWHNANVHRGIHTLAEEATAEFEGARTKIAEFIGAQDSREVIFTRNATEAINLVAKTWGSSNLKEGDRIVVSEMEHHSNLVPWQMLSAEQGLEINVLPVTEQGELDLREWERLLNKEPKIVCFTHMSNVLGTLNPVAEMCAQARDAGAVSVVDGAQSAPHLPVDVRAIGADFFAFSGHKMCGPTGGGVLWGRAKLLNEMPPFLGGGDMIKRVQMTGFEPNEIPYKFEAGTPSICEAIGLGAAVEYLESVGMESIWKHEQELISYALEGLGEINGITVYGPEAHKRGGVASFTLEGVHPHDIAQVLDRDGVAVRAGHHCAMPLHTKLNVVATARASFYLYNTQDEVDLLVEGIGRVRDMFR